MSILDDPYPIYREMREWAPVCWDARRNLWVLTRYRDVTKALREPRLSSASPGDGSDGDSAGAVQRLFASHVELCDPPLHTRLRRHLRSAFADLDPRQLSELVASRARRLIDDLCAAGGGDVARDLASPLSHTVLLDVLGIKSEDHSRFRQSVDRLLSEFQRGADLVDGEAVQSSIDALSAIIDDARRHRGSGLISSLAFSDQGQQPLSEPEIIANVALLYAAGHGTTANLISNGVLALLRNPRQMGALREDGRRIDGAVEEMLRFDSPIQSVGRVARADVEVAGHTFRRGQTVVLSLGSANRDDEFPDPDQFRIDRLRNNHLAFGLGIHFCLGASLARLQCRTAIGMLMRRTSDIRLTADHVAWSADPTYRGVRTLPVSCLAS
jgi:cytochrome P450